MRAADKIGDVRDVKKELIHKIALRHAVEEDIDKLIVEARAQTPPVEYAILEEITGYSREWLRKIANGVAGNSRPRRRSNKG